MTVPPAVTSPAVGDGTTSQPGRSRPLTTSAPLPSFFARWERLPFPVLCLAVGLFWCVVSFILYAPPLFIPIYPTARIVDLMKLAEHPLRRALYEPILSASEEGLHLRHNERRQCGRVAVGFQIAEKGPPVGPQGLVEECLFGAMALVSGLVLGGLF